MWKQHISQIVKQRCPKQIIAWKYIGLWLCVTNIWRSSQNGREGQKISYTSRFQNATVNQIQFWCNVNHRIKRSSPRVWTPSFITTTRTCCSLLSLEWCPEGVSTCYCVASSNHSLSSPAMRISFSNRLFSLQDDFPNRCPRPVKLKCVH